MGMAVFVMWVGLDPFFPKNHIFFSPTPSDIEWNPFARYGAGFRTRLVFCHRAPPRAPRSSSRRWRKFFGARFFTAIASGHEFSIAAVELFHPTSFIVVSLLFGLEHYEWVQGFLCGMAYQWLVINKNRLGDAIAAHAITNFLLGLWVIGRGAWHFW